jgi:hypothetical protein
MGETAKVQAKNSFNASPQQERTWAKLKTRPFTEESEAVKAFAAPTSQSQSPPNQQAQREKVARAGFNFLNIPLYSHEQASASPALSKGIQRQAEDNDEEVSPNAVQRQAEDVVLQPKCECGHKQENINLKPEVGMLQRQKEDELVPKASAIQRQAEDNEEPSPDAVQRQAGDKDEPSSEASAVQRQAEDKDEELSPNAVQRQAEDKDEEASPNAVQRQAENDGESLEADTVQRQAEDKDEEPSPDTIQRRATSAAIPKPKVNLKPSGAGSPLPGPVQQKMADAFGTDFSDVRVHEGSQAKSINALAYTQGNHVHFAPGKYNPTSQEGQKLLGHELTHVVQQRAGRVPVPQGKGTPINADPALEAEADELGAKAAKGERVTVAGSSSGLQRKSAQTAPIQRWKMPGFLEAAKNKAAGLVNAAKNQASNVVKTAQNTASSVVKTATNKASSAVKAATNKASGVVKAATSKASSVVKAATNKASGVVKAATSKASSVVKAATNKASGVVKAATSKASSVVKAATNKASSVVKAATSKASIVVKAATNKASKLTSSIVKTAKNKASSVVNAAKNKASSIVKAATNKTFNLVKAAKNKASSVVNSTKNKVSNVVKAATNKVSSGFNTVKEGLKNVNWRDAGHAALDIAGFIPVVGAVADVANAAWYFAEGDYANAALSGVSAIPGLGDALGAAGKAGKFLPNAGKLVDKVGGLANKVPPGLKSIPGKAIDRLKSIPIPNKVKSSVSTAMKAAEFVGVGSSLEAAGEYARQGDYVNAILSVTSGFLGARQLGKGEVNAAQTVPNKAPSTKTPGGAKSNRDLPMTTKEKEVLNNTASKRGNELTPKELNAEGEVARRAERKPSDDGEHVEQIDLPNGHELKKRQDGTWCRFSLEPGDCGWQHNPDRPTEAQTPKIEEQISKGSTDAADSIHDSRAGRLRNPTRIKKNKGVGKLTEHFWKKHFKAEAEAGNIEVHIHQTTLKSPTIRKTIELDGKRRQLDDFVKPDGRPGIAIEVKATPTAAQSHEAQKQRERTQAGINQGAVAGNKTDGYHKVEAQVTKVGLPILGAGGNTGPHLLDPPLSLPHLLSNDAARIAKGATAKVRQDVGLSNRGYRPAPGERAMTREQWKRQSGGYKSGTRETDPLKSDKSTGSTQQLTEWRRRIKKSDIGSQRSRFLGEGYVKVGPGKWRSIDGTRQFRVKPDDYLGRHPIGQPPVPHTPHIHFEFLEPTQSGNKFKVRKNIHVPLE